MGARVTTSKVDCMFQMMGKASLIALALMFRTFRILTRRGKGPTEQLFVEFISRGRMSASKESSCRSRAITTKRAEGVNSTNGSTMYQSRTVAEEREREKKPTRPASKTKIRSTNTKRVRRVKQDRDKRSTEDGEPAHICNRRREGSTQTERTGKRKFLSSDGAMLYLLFKIL